MIWILHKILKSGGIYKMYNKYLNTQITGSDIPNHVGIILDGNRRWAVNNNSGLGFGHKAGANVATELLEWCHELKIKTLTIYALSDENLNRSQEELEEITGLKVDLVNCRFIKPLDMNILKDIPTNYKGVITIEEGSIGGFGSHVFQLVSDRGILDKGLKIRSMIFPDLFLDQDTPDNMYKKAGLDAHSIEQKAIETLKSNIILKQSKQRY